MSEADTNIVPFIFDHQHLLRVIRRADGPWFFNTEACARLKIKNAADAAGRLDPDERDVIGLTDSIGRFQNATIINRSGFYAFALRSRDAMKAGTEAHRFRKWVTSQVLPEIDRTGGYRGHGPARSAKDPAVEMIKAQAALINANNKTVTNARLLFGRVEAARIYDKVGLPRCPDPRTAKESDLLSGLGNSPAAGSMN